MVEGKVTLSGVCVCSLQQVQGSENGWHERSKRSRVVLRQALNHQPQGSEATCRWEAGEVIGWRANIRVETRTR